MSVLSTLVAFAGHYLSLLWQHAGPIGKYLAVYAALHVVFEFVGPRVPLVGRLYTSMNPGHKLSQRAVNADVRTKLICVVMAIWVVTLCWQGLLTPEGQALLVQPHGSTAVTWALVYNATAFFMWDIFVCIRDREPLVFHVHGWACLLTFGLALQPLNHYMSQVVLLQETSTIFLHWRKYLIAAKRTEGLHFTVVQLLFGLTFLLFRIVVGYYACFQWALRAVEHASKPHLHPTPLLTGHRAEELLATPTSLALYVSMATCAILASMNAFWFSQMIATACGGGKGKSKRRATKAAGGMEGRGQEEGSEISTDAGKQARSLSELDFTDELPPATPRTPSSADSKKRK